MRPLALREMCREPIRHPRGRLIARCFPRAPLIAAALSALAGPTAATAAPKPLTIEPPNCCGTAAIATYRAWAAWSRYIPATHQYQLVFRSPFGVDTTPAVPQRAEPFDVSIGPTPSGPVAVFSRCADPRTLQGCTLHELSLAEPAAERALSPPGGGSLHEPSIWASQLVFLRRRGSGIEDPEHPSAHPDELISWEIGSAHASRQTLASSKGSRGVVRWPRGLTGVVTGLTLANTWIAYVTDTASGTSGLSTLWARRTGQGPRLIDQVTGGAGNVCVPRFLSPSLAGPSRLSAYLHDCSPSGSNLDRWTRYSLTTHTAQRARYRFTSVPDEAIASVLPYGPEGVIWGGEQGIRATAGVKWSFIPRPRPESFCGHTDLIC